MTPERQAATTVVPAKLPGRPTPVPQWLSLMPERLPVPQRFPAVPERQTPKTVLVDSDRRVVLERLPVPATLTPLPQRPSVMPEKLAEPMRENMLSRQPKKLEPNMAKYSQIHQIWYLGRLFGDNKFRQVGCP